MNTIGSITKFATDRLIDKMDYSYNNYVANVMEELLELNGYDVPKDKRSDLRYYSMEFMNSLVDKLNIREVDTKPTTFSCTVDMQVDALGDIAVFSLTEMTKLGYNPDKVMQEVSLEINSRAGSIVNGKFEKDLSDEARDAWHTADFTNCKL